MSHEAIFIIVNKEKLEAVLAAAEKAGSTGGTIIHGRGVGSAVKSKLFDLPIEPEKEIILILSEEEKTAAIVEAVDREMNAGQDFSGVVFVMPVNETRGLFTK